jgi:hypothetical protein
VSEAVPPKPKPAWPLFLVAVLSFVPILGIVFGGAGATWGLVSSRPRAIRAALIAMTGALLNIVVMFLLGMGVGAKPAAALQARHDLTQTELLAVVVALEDYHAAEHAYPPSLQVLQRRMLPRRIVPTMDLSAGPLHFPHEYRYVVAPDGETYDLYAAGPDNVAGTADDVRPLLPDSIRVRSGYRPPIPGAHP